MTEQHNIFAFALPTDPHEMASEPEPRDLPMRTMYALESFYLSPLRTTEEFIVAFENIGDETFVEVATHDLLPEEERRPGVKFVGYLAIGDEAMRRAKIVWRLARARLS